MNNDRQTRGIPEAVSKLIKLRPRIGEPAPSVLARLTASDRQIVLRRLSEASECVFDPTFRRESTARVVLSAPVPTASTRSTAVIDSDDSGIDLLTGLAPRVIKLTAAQERVLFLRYNYCRYRVMRILKAHQGKRMSAEGVRDLLRWEHLAMDTRTQIVHANMALVLAMAKRSRGANVDFSEMVSEGNLALLRSIEKFDCARGFKFSTYACRAILKAFSRVAGLSARYRLRFPTEYDPTLEKSDFVEQQRDALEASAVAELKSILGDNLADLTDVEQRVLNARFALDAADADDPNSAGKTLEQVGNLIGVTKERVRQIQNRAVEKIRGVLELRLQTV